MATEAEQLAEIKALIMGIGPKEVRTPNMTVIAHDPKQVQQVLERRASVNPTMCSIGGCVGVPKAAAYRGFTASYDPSVD